MLAPVNLTGWSLLDEEGLHESVYSDFALLIMAYWFPSHTNLHIKLPASGIVDQILEDIVGKIEMNHTSKAFAWNIR